MPLRLKPGTNLRPAPASLSCELPTNLRSDIMLDVASVAIGQSSLLHGRAVDWRQPRVATQTLASALNLSRRSFLAAGACAWSVLGPKPARGQGGIWQEYRRDDVGFRIEMPGEP